MLDEKFRHHFQKYFVDPLIYRLPTKNISPSAFTLLALCLGISAAASFSVGFSYLGSMLLLLSGYFDVVDGSFARMQKASSAKGAVFDIFSDRVVEFAIIFSLFSIDMGSRAQASMWMLGSCFLCVTSFLVVGIFTKNASEKSFCYTPGLMERAEALLFFISMALFPTAFFFLSYLFTFLVLFTSFMRLQEFFLQSSIV